MAELIKCIECGHQTSSNALKCPSCGESPLGVLCCICSQRGSKLEVTAHESIPHTRNPNGFATSWDHFCSHAYCRQQILEPLIVRLPAYVTCPTCKDKIATNQNIKECPKCGETRVVTNDYQQFWHPPVGLHFCELCRLPLSENNSVKVGYYFVHRVCAKSRKLKTAGSCFIATAVYGCEDAQEVRQLRQFRDEVLLDSRIGQMFVKAYYRVSPPLARVIEKSRILQGIIRKIIFSPLLQLLSRPKI